MGPGKHFGAGGHLWLAYWSIGIQREHLDYTEAPGSSRSSSQENLSPRAVVFRVHQRKCTALADAIQHNFQDPTKLTPAYALLSRIRLSSSGDVLASAEQVVQHIISAYSEPNLAPEEIQSRATKRHDPLRGFSKVCRAELEAMQNQLR